MTFCEATTKGGLPCEGMALADGKFCTFHAPKHAKANKEGRKEGGRSRKRAADTPDAPPPVLEAERDVLAILRDAIHKVRTGAFDPKIANAVGYLCGVALSVFKQSGTDKKLDELEQRTRPLEGMSFEQLLEISRSLAARKAVESGDSKSPEH